MKDSKATGGVGLGKGMDMAERWKEPEDIVLLKRTEYCI